MYADRHGDGYYPHEPLPECERYSTKAEKFARLWSINAGRDTQHGKRKDVDRRRMSPRQPPHSGPSSVRARRRGYLRPTWSRA